VPLAAAVQPLADGIAALSGAVEAVRSLGAWAGALLVLLGVATLTVATRFARPLAAWGGAVLGAIGALALHRPIQAHLGAAPHLAAAVGALAAGLAFGAFPAAFPFAVGALPGALVGLAVPLAGSAALGAGAGVLVGGIVGMAAARVVKAGFASLTGGLLVAVGLAAAAGARPLGRELAARPFVLAGLAIVLGIAGAAFQMGREEAAPGPAPLRDPDERREGVP
jgi:hypothetical protein